MNKIQTPGRHPFSIPVKGGQPIEGVRLVGNQPGKTLVVTAGVHGDEYVGIQAVRELLAQLSPGELSGQVIFVPVVNAGGFFAGTYLVPEDGENLNRCFPGAKGETYTWNMASALEAALYPQADFLLDLHSGGIYESMEPLAFFPVDAGETVERISRQAGQTLSLTFLVQSFARDGLYSWAAQQGIPGLLVERGPRASEPHTQAVKESIAYMRRNLDQELSLERLADQAALSPSHYIRVFRRYTGQTPFAFLSDLRLREAAHCLEQGMTVSETALHVGLGNLSYFIRLFRQRYGQTPKQYQLGLTSRKK